MPGDPFYHSPEWKALRREAVKRDGYMCVKCHASVKASGLSRVNHKLSRKMRPDLALSLSNLETLCAACDNKHHNEKSQAGKKHPVRADGMPTDPAHHWANKAKPSAKS